MQNNTFTIERIMNAPHELVWQSLTDYSLLKQWLPFFPDFQAKVGFSTSFKLGRDDEHQYTHLCEVIDIVEGGKLSYTWHYQGFPGNSFVTFELFPKGDQTRVVLTHTITEEFPSDNPDFDRKNFAEGWTYTIDGLKEFAEKLAPRNTERNQV